MRNKEDELNFYLKNEPKISKLIRTHLKNTISLPKRQIFAIVGILDLILLFIRTRKPKRFYLSLYIRIASENTTNASEIFLRISPSVHSSLSLSFLLENGIGNEQITAAFIARSVVSRD